MKMQNCFEAYVEGGRHRLARPLHEGLYKLRDFRANHEQWHSELLYIRRHISGLDRIPQFLCCTRAELPSWLKHLPSWIAYAIGHDLLPAMEALILDGIPSHLIDQERSHIQSRAFLLLDQLDTQSDVLSRGIEAEYNQMRKGKSRLEFLTERAINLADRAIQIGDSHHGACTPVPNQNTVNLTGLSLFEELSCPCF